MIPLLSIRVPDTIILEKTKNVINEIFTLVKNTPIFNTHNSIPYFHLIEGMARHCETKTILLHRSFEQLPFDTCLLRGILSSAL